MPSCAQAVEHSLGASGSYNTALSLEEHHLHVACQIIADEDVDLLGELDAESREEFKQIVARIISEPRGPRKSSCSHIPRSPHIPPCAVLA